MADWLKEAARQPDLLWGAMAWRLFGIPQRRSFTDTVQSLPVLHRKTLFAGLPLAGPATRAHGPRTQVLPTTNSLKISPTNYFSKALAY